MKKRCATVTSCWWYCRLLIPFLAFSVSPWLATAADETLAIDVPTIVISDSVPSAPWYDAQEGSVVALPVNPRSDDSINRSSRWLPKPKAIKKRDPSSNATANSGGTSGNSTGVFGSSLTLWNLFGWVLLVVFVMGLVGLIVYLVSRAELKMQKGSGSAVGDFDADGLPDEQTLERIKHLPPELRRTDVNLKTECERLMGEGQFEQAIILLLGHQLLLLDRNGLLRLSRGKTNGKYVRETRAHDESIARWLRETANAFEHSYFGRHEIPSDVFRQLWQQNGQLESSAQSLGAGK